LIPPGSYCMLLYIPVTMAKTMPFFALQSPGFSSFVAHDSPKVPTHKPVYAFLHKRKHLYYFRVTLVLRWIPSFSFLAHLPCSLYCPKPKRPGYFACPDRMNILVNSRSLRVSNQLPGAYLFLPFQDIKRKQLHENAVRCSFCCSSHSRLKYRLKLIA
jgi:hypothetical protein